MVGMPISPMVRLALSEIKSTRKGFAVLFARPPSRTNVVGLETCVCAKHIRKGAEYIGTRMCRELRELPTICRGVRASRSYHFDILPHLLLPSAASSSLHYLIAVASHELAK